MNGTLNLFYLKLHESQFMSNVQHHHCFEPNYEFVKYTGVALICIRFQIFCRELIPIYLATLSLSLSLWHVRALTLTHKHTPLAPTNTAHTQMLPNSKQLEIIYSPGSSQPIPNFVFITGLELDLNESFFNSQLFNFHAHR